MTGFHPVSDQSLGEYLDGWLERAAQTKKFRTYQTYEGDFRNHVKPRLGSVKLRDIRRLHVQNLVDEVFRESHVSGRKGQAVARKVRACLRTALQDAVDLEVLMRNPCDGVKVPAEPVSCIEIWSDKDHHAFMETVAKSRLYPIIYTRGVQVKMH